MPQETSQAFSGFQEDDMALIRLPEAFFSQVMPKIETLSQLQLTLYFFWHFEQQKTSLRFLKLIDLTSDPELVAMIGSRQAILSDINELVEMGVLLSAAPGNTGESLYFINGPQGRAAVQAINNDTWQTRDIERKPIQLTDQQPNIFKLYEENIGSITPIMAEILKDDEKNYPESWIREAIEIAVKKNVRNWKYIQAILERWQTEGRGNEQNRRNDSQDPIRYRKWLEK